MPTAGPPPNSRPSAASIARNQAVGPNVPNAWANTNGSTYLKRALSNANSQMSTSSKAPRSAYPAAPTAGNSRLAQTNNASSSTATPPANAPTGPCAMQQPYMSPSMAPAASTAPAASQAGSRYSTRSTGPRPQRFKNDVCELSNWAPAHYKLGDIIAVPFHEPNTNPNLKVGNANLTKTIDGHAFTKRRMVVVLWMYAEDMFCLPLYSFEGNGFMAKPTWYHAEYVSLGNEGDQNFKGQGLYDPIFATHKPTRDPFHPQSAVHLGGGFKVACRANNSYCGRLTEASYYALVQLWQDQCNKSKKQKYV